MENPVKRSVAPVLITGGAGFIGYNLAKALVAAEVPVRILDNLSVQSESGIPLNTFEWTSSPTPSTVYRLPSTVDGLGVRADSSSPSTVYRLPSTDFEFIKGDVGDPVILKEAVKGVQAVVHLAARPGVADSVADPMADFQANVVATMQLLMACVAEKESNNPALRFIFASSGAATGQVPPPAHEKQPARPLSPYAAAKLAGEGYCSAFWASYGLHTTALRFSNIYGAESWHKKNAIHMFSKQILRGEPLRINGDGEQTRDFLYVGDLVKAIKACVEKPDLPGGEVFQLGSGKPTSVNQLLQTFREVVNYDFEVIYGAAARGEVRHTYADISKARQLLDFNPVVELKEGLAQTFAWYEANQGQYQGKVKETGSD